MITPAEDVWQKLSTAQKPVILYGTGNGADKILAVFKQYGIKVSGIFASDGFVRDRVFHGMKVMSYSDIKEQFTDFIAVIAFASSLDSVLDSMYTIAEAHETYAPDVPVTGETLFDIFFYNNHKSEFDKARSILSDEESVFIFDCVVKYKLSGKIEYLCQAVSDKEKVWNSLLHPSDYGSYCDLGAYNGDTIRELYTHSRSVKEIYAFEPDPRTFRKLTDFCKTNRIDAHLFLAGAWNSAGKSAFAARGSRSSGITAGGRTAETELITLDSVLGGKRTDYIKYDVEGAEYEALSGSAETIKKHKPDLCVSLYHRSEDLFHLPLYIKSLNPDYKFFIRRFKYIPAWDLNLYCI
ncbi:MAG: FkbM family methyltransferase [Eubacteriales bacterium]